MCKTLLQSSTIHSLNLCDMVITMEGDRNGGIRHLRPQLISFLHRRSGLSLSMLWAGKGVKLLWLLPCLTAPPRRGSFLAPTTGCVPFPFKCHRSLDAICLSPSQNTSRLALHQGTPFDQWFSSPGQRLSLEYRLETALVGNLPLCEPLETVRPPRKAHLSNPPQSHRQTTSLPFHNAPGQRRVGWIRTSCSLSPTKLRIHPWCVTETMYVGGLTTLSHPHPWAFPVDMSQSLCSNGPWWCWWVQEGTVRYRPADVPQKSWGCYVQVAGRQRGPKCKTQCWGKNTFSLLLLLLLQFTVTWFEFRSPGLVVWVAESLWGKGHWWDSDVGAEQLGPQTASTSTP